MKPLLFLLLGLLAAPCAVFAGSELPSIPFATGKQQFRPGDGIAIDEVRASSPRMGVGDRVVVHGHYTLASARTAKLGLFVTHRGPAGPDAVEKSQGATVEGPGGTFELSCEIAYVGDLHVSFYPAGGGESFGGIYILPAEPPR